MTNPPRHSVTPTWVRPTLDTTPLWTEPGSFAYDLWKNVSIGVWVGQATLPAVKGLLAMSAEMKRRYPGGRSSVVFVMDQVPAPTGEARDALDQIYGQEGLACTSIVLEGSGFWASAIRSMSSNLARAGGGVAVRVHTNIDDVVAWLPAEHQQRTGVALPSDDLKRALVNARHAAEQRARKSK